MPAIAAMMDRATIGAGPRGQNHRHGRDVNPADAAVAERLDDAVARREIGAWQAGVGLREPAGDSQYAQCAESR
jgi:hypothetical protein